MPKKKPVFNKTIRTTVHDPSIDPMSIEAQINHAKLDHQELDDQSLKPKVTQPSLPSNAVRKPIERNPPIRTESFKPKQRVIDKLMDENNHYLAQIREKVEQGASKATIDALLMMPPGTIDRLLMKGKESTDKRCKYKKFYLLYRRWAGEARSVAEAVTLHKTPEKWMDRNSSNKLLESEEDRTILQQQPALTNGHNSGLSAEKMLEALKILQEQGISIDEALSKDAIILDTTTTPLLPNKDDDEDD